MTDYVKHLPTAALPEGVVPAWRVGDAQRWLDARVPAAWAPTATGLLLAGLAAVSIVLTPLGDVEPARHGEDWRGFAMGVLLTGLPVWFRYLPAATLVAAPVLAANAVLVLPGSPDTVGRIGHGLVLALSAWAFTGALVRLRARRRQRELALAAAGSARFPLPAPLPTGHRRRGLPGIVLGLACCVGAAAALAHGVRLEVRASGGADPYDPFGMQLLAWMLLVPGTTLLGRGLARRRAARRLHRRPQPALVVGVRDSASGHDWLLPDADTTTAPPLIALFARSRDTLSGRRVLLAGSQRNLRTSHHDIHPRTEPFEAVLYGAVHEGAEVVLESAVYAGDTRLVSHVTAAPRSRAAATACAPGSRPPARTARPSGSRHAWRRRGGANGSGSARSRRAPTPPPPAAAEGAVGDAAGDAAAAADPAACPRRSFRFPVRSLQFRGRVRPAPPGRPSRSAGSGPRHGPRRPPVPPRPLGRAG
ncbi:hypothetical protein WKI68_01905 [Streptomyces sp. MS1.HAVA.3]|uniref:Integral membrane protein n=1 Tax=Streptomyces caledonius TaxID=3134107 RepID=A0ABU8TY27_9ACTN